jgi:pyridoxal 5'-phosphate synthase pdxT subunit
MIKIGVLDLQGDVSEHLEMTKKATKNINLRAKVSMVKTAKEVAECNAIIISGGESTVIGKLMEEESIITLVKQNKIPVFGTCAGMILLGRETDYKQPLMGLIPMKVKRNGFGRQKLSFEAEVDIFGDTYPGVFIRAPYAYDVKEEANILSQIQDKVVAVAHNGNLAIAFHPELTEDTRIHEYFIKEVAKCVE